MGPVFGVPVIGFPSDPALVAPTANALEFRIESEYRQLRIVSDGVAVQMPKFSRAEACPPTANESWP